MSRLFLCMACRCACVLLFAHTSLVHSQASEPQLGFDDAIARSVERSLDLKVFKFDLDAQQARSQQARAQPAVDVSLLHIEIERLTGISLGNPLER